MFNRRINIPQVIVDFIVATLKIWLKVHKTLNKTFIFMNFSFPLDLIEAFSDRFTFVSQKNNQKCPVLTFFSSFYFNF